MENRSKNIILHFIEESWLLIIAAIFFATLLSVLNAAWSEKIETNLEMKFNSQASLMLPDASTFEPIADITIDTGKGTPQPVTVKKALDAKGQLVGWAFKAVGAGFADKIQLVVAVSADFTIMKGYSVLSSNETPGFGDKIAIPNGYYQKQFVGIPTGELVLSKTGDPSVVDDTIVAISGATVSSQAVVDTLNTYVGKVKDALRTKGLIEKAD